MTIRFKLTMAFILKETSIDRAIEDITGVSQKKLDDFADPDEDEEEEEDE